MKKGQIVGVWNHDQSREDIGLVVDIKDIRSKYNNQLNKKYFVVIEEKVYELYNFQIFKPGNATKNIPAASTAKCFFSKQDTYERIDLATQRTE
jgi:hypothetical protein